MAEQDEIKNQTPLEKMMLGALRNEKRFAFSLRGLEPEDMDRIFSAFCAVHVFGGDTSSGTTDESFSAIRKLCEVQELEPIFEAREYPALRRGKSSGHKIIVLPDSGNKDQNQKTSLEVIHYFSSLEASTTARTIIGIIENFDAPDIIRYVEKYPSHMDDRQLSEFKQRMLARYGKEAELRNEEKVDSEPEEEET